METSQMRDTKYPCTLLASVMGMPQTSSAVRCRGSGSPFSCAIPTACRELLSCSPAPRALLPLLALWHARRMRRQHEVTGKRAH